MPFLDINTSPDKVPRRFPFLDILKRYETHISIKIIQGRWVSDLRMSCMVHVCVSYDRYTHKRVPPDAQNHPPKRFGTCSNRLVSGSHVCSPPTHNTI